MVFSIHSVRPELQEVQVAAAVAFHPCAVGAQTGASLPPRPPHQLPPPPSPPKYEQTMKHQRVLSIAVQLATEHTTPYASRGGGAEGQSEGLAPAHSAGT